MVLASPVSARAIQIDWMLYVSLCNQRIQELYEQGRIYMCRWLVMYTQSIRTRFKKSEYFLAVRFIMSVERYPQVPLADQQLSTLFLRLFMAAPMTMQIEIPWLPQAHPASKGPVNLLALFALHLNRMQVKVYLIVFPMSQNCLAAPKYHLPIVY